jgi:hypothetical protein
MDEAIRSIRRYLFYWWKWGNLEWNL